MLENDRHVPSLAVELCKRIAHHGNSANPGGPRLTVPEYRHLLLPLLRLTGDGLDHHMSAAHNILAHQFQLTDTDLSELIPSGTQGKFFNRVGWAATYLRKARLIESTGRATIRITDRGQSVLSDPPDEITPRYLRRFPEFAQFQTAVRIPGGATDEPGLDTQTPQETLDASYRSLRQALASDLLDQIKSCSPRFFERLVLDLLVAMGYGGSRQDAAEAVGRSGDGGIDGIIKEDKLGLDVVYIQAKRWNSSVGRPEVQGFAGSLEGVRARKGVFITTSKFSQEAREYVTRIEKRIVLIDGEELAQHMIDYGLGVSVEETYVVKRLDLDYFNEG
jgi:restriction system protein